MEISLENLYMDMVISFVCLLPVFPLLSSMADLYHVNDWLQRAYSREILLVLRKDLSNNIHKVVNMCNNSLTLILQLIFFKISYTTWSKMSVSGHFACNQKF